jgi:zinc transport system substrate-binding protein
MEIIINKEACANNERQDMTVHRLSRAWSVGLGVPFAAALIAACGSTGGAVTSPTPPEATAGTDSPATTLTVVASIYPLQYATEQVGQERVEVINLTPPGADPHDYELTPQQVALIGQADLVVYIPDLMPALDKAIAQQAPERALNVLTAIPDIREGHDHDDHGHDDHDDHGHDDHDDHGHDDHDDHGHDDHDDHGHDDHRHGGIDPHVWLNPLNMSIIGDEIAGALSELAPSASDGFADGAKNLSQNMDSLNDAWKAGTARCDSRILVVPHEAFGYLADQYDFEQIGIAGINPEAEPSPAKLAEVIRLVDEKSIQTIYFERQASPKIAEIVAAETGAATSVLDPLEAPPVNASDTYISVMQQNLTNIKSGNGCQ